MKYSSKEKSKISKKQSARVWMVRIFAILLAALMVAGACYYTIWALLA